MAELGKLTRIDAREVWTHEAHDFTPWLKEHIELLGSALGLDLDLVESEVSVGPFAADLVAKDVSNDRWVVIENQLAATDHSHLGQLLTYGAGTEAAVFVWISPDFRDEHRAALDWLNEHSDEDSLFFGVQIELLAVDDSRPAPNFRLVASPNEWRKSTKRERALTEKQAAYMSFFGQLLDTFKQRYPGETNVAKPTTASWLGMGIGRTGLMTEWLFVGNGGFRCEFYIDSGDGAANLSIFEQLVSHKEAIEASMGRALEWDPMQGRKACRIMSSYPGSPITALAPDSELAELTEWAMEEMKLLREAFRPFVKDLQFAGDETGAAGSER